MDEKEMKHFSTELSNLGRELKRNLLDNYTIVK